MGKIKFHVIVADEGVGPLMRFLAGMGEHMEAFEFEDEVDLDEAERVGEAVERFGVEQGSIVKKKRKVKRKKKAKKDKGGKLGDKATALMNAIIAEWHNSDAEAVFTKERIVALAAHPMVDMAFTSVAGFLTKMVKAERLQKVGRGKYALGPAVLGDKEPGEG